jgi:hypothetical protein
MSSRPLMQPTLVIKNGDMTTTLTSAVTILTNISVISYTYSWAGSNPIGTVIVQASNDYTENAAGAPSNPGTWNTLPLSASTMTSGNTGNGAIDIDITGFYAIRTVYTPTSGSGTLQATVKGKVQ